MAQYHNNEFIQDYVSDPATFPYQCTILGYKGADRVNGLLAENPFSLEWGASWQDSNTGQYAQSLLSSGAGLAQKAMTKAAGSAIGGLAGANISDRFSQQLGASTIQKFAGVSGVTFTVELYCINKARGAMPYIEFIKNSLALVSPPEVDSGMIVQPDEYVPPFTIESFKPGGVYGCHVLMGDKSKAHLHIWDLVCNSFVYSASVQNGDDGKPLYIKGTYNFKYARVCGYEEYLRWFVNY